MFMSDTHPFLTGEFTPKELEALKRLNRRHIVFAVSSDELKGLDPEKVREFFERELTFQRIRRRLELSSKYREPKRVIRKVDIKRKTIRLISIRSRRK